MKIGSSKQVSAWPAKAGCQKEEELPVGLPLPMNLEIKIEHLPKHSASLQKLLWGGGDSCGQDQRQPMNLLGASPIEKTFVA